VYTSGEEGELFLNGKSLGRKTRGAYEYRLRWDDVVYQPGELKVVTYKDHRRWAEDTVRTTGPASGLALKPERNLLKADGNDLAFITVSIVDNGGLVVPRTKNHLKFQVSGAGEIVGMDNGDATSFEPFQGIEHSAFNGLCLVIVRSTGKPGEITLEATSDGLRTGRLSLQAK
jgi:beta-galactosidase